MDLITEGQKITLFFQKNTNMVEMKCSIEKVYDDRLDLVLPQYFMRYIDFLQVGSKLTVKVFSKLGTIDFNTVILCSPMEENFTIELDYNSLKLTPNEEIPVISAIEIVEIVDSDLVNTHKSFEISTEQIKIYSDKKYQVDDEVNCRLVLPEDYGIIKFIGTVVEVDPVYSTEYTIKYRTMTEENRQNLLYYMYMYSTNSD